MTAYGTLIQMRLGVGTDCDRNKWEGVFAISSAVSQTGTAKNIN